MLQISFIRKNKNKVLEGLKKRCFNNINFIEEILFLDKRKKKKKKKLDYYLHKINLISKDISFNLKTNNNLKIKVLSEKSLFYKKKSKILIKKVNNIKTILLDKLLNIPNIPSEIVNKGKNKNDNEVVYIEGDIPKLSDSFLSHLELGKKFKIFDFDIGSKISGSGFLIYIGKGALLQRSLIKYFLDQNIKAGYIEYIVPYLVNEKSVYNTGQLPDKEKNMYYIKKDNLYLIPTSEVSIMNCYRNKILKYFELPIKITSYTSCFRREAGSYGKKVKGLNRIHQFDKVEIIQITTPEKSHEALNNMIEHVKMLLRSLSLPFRIIKLCGRDLGFTSSITYDFEIYSVLQKRWLEVSSISNCLDFQSYRLKLRYRSVNNSIKFCHTLNGSSLALPRILSVLLENNQTLDNKINIPKVLISYTGLNCIN